MLMVFFYNDAWNTMLSITGVMVLPPYLASTAYLWKISQEKELNKVVPNLHISSNMALLSGIVGSIYAVWLIYAAGLNYLLDSVIFLALGIPFYIWARKENGLKVFTKAEICIAAALVAIAVYGITDPA